MRDQDTFLARAAVMASTICRSLRARASACAFEEVFRDRAFVAGFRFVILEACCEFVGVVENVLDRARHQFSRNLLGAGMA